MTITDEIKDAFQSRQIPLRDNTVIVVSSDNLNIAAITNGILIVYASWSVPTIVNCLATVQQLYNIDYNGQIIIVDIDCMTAEFQKNIFGHVCHGWCEIFNIQNGQIIEKYLGKDSYANFKVETERQKRSR